MIFTPHKIRNIDKSICNCEQKIAYNYLSSYYDMTKSDFLDFCQKSLARQKENQMKKYDIDLIYHYLLNSYNKYITAGHPILTSYEAIGEIITGIYWEVEKMDNKRAIQFIKESGYKTITEFSKAVNEDVSNTRKVLIGKQKPNIEKCFNYANALHCTIDQVLMLFYSDLFNDHIRTYNKEH